MKHFTHTGHINEDMSKFKYFDDTDYYTYNEGWDTHTPIFSDDIDPSILDDIEEVCGGLQECIFDYAVTNNASFAAATHAVSVENEEAHSILGELCKSIIIHT